MANLSFPPPAINYLTGSLCLYVKTPAWLQYADADAHAAVTFGVYKSQSGQRFIYRCESY